MVRRSDGSASSRISFWIHAPNIKQLLLLQIVLNAIPTSYRATTVNSGYVLWRSVKDEMKSTDAKMEDYLLFPTWLIVEKPTISWARSWITKGSLMSSDFDRMHWSTRFSNALRWLTASCYENINGERFATCLLNRSPTSALKDQDGTMNKSEAKSFEAASIWKIEWILPQLRKKLGL